METFLRLAALAAIMAWPPTPAAAWTQVEVTDGDTVRVVSGGTATGFRIRILDVDLPEINGRCPEEQALAQQARSRLIQLAAPGVTFETDFRTDRYGRVLARMRLKNGRDAGEVLIAEGLAHRYDGRGPRRGWCP